jgi:hypothetical protein
MPRAAWITMQPCAVRGDNPVQAPCLRHAASISPLRRHIADPFRVGGLRGAQGEYDVTWRPCRLTSDRPETGRLCGEVDQKPTCSSQACAMARWPEA